MTTATAIILLAGLAGLVTGSFLNVVIHRWGSQVADGDEEKASASSDGSKTIPGKAEGLCYPPRSYCPQCKATLGWSENIPLLSWLAQGGKCKHCAKPIPWRYPAVEAANALWWAGCAMTMSAASPSQWLIAAVLGSIGIAAAWIDAEHHRIPDKLTLGGAILLLILITTTQPSHIIVQGLLGAAVGAGTIALLILGGGLVFAHRKTKLKEALNMRLSPEGVTLQETPVWEENETMTLDEMIKKPSHRIVIEGFGTHEKRTEGGKRPKEVNGILTITATETTWLPKPLAENLSRTKKAKEQEGPTPEVPIKITHWEGSFKVITHPADPMGWGDAKLMLPIGLVLGPAWALATIGLGAVASLPYVAAGRIGALIKKSSPPDIIAFGPWLVLGAGWWLASKGPWAAPWW